ncbi:MAG TPA: hypothetical protein VFQ88_01115 [Nevskiaceae bacterium]|nr:hypothetical protein [Nevskiaceae bacterium]
MAPLNQKQSIEMELARRCLQDIGRGGAHLEAGDRPDVVTVIDGKRTGIEVTQFHADERSGVKGSALRAKEEKCLKISGPRATSTWIPADPHPALIARITEKITTASKYDNTCYDQLWLLISSQIPMMSATASTHTFAFLIDITKLDAATHMQLFGSAFSAVHVHLMRDHKVFSWSRAERWRGRCELR